MNTLSPSAPEEILVQLPEECRRYVENKVLTLHGVSSLFKSIRLDIDFNPLMKDFELAAPVTELLLAPLPNGVCRSCGLCLPNDAGMLRAERPAADHHAGECE